MSAVYPASVGPTFASTTLALTSKKYFSKFHKLN